MTNLFLESGFASFNKHGESISGDFYTTIKGKDKTTFVLSDGLGSGIKANILATLTSKILGTMMASNMSIEESVYTIAKSLPVCKVRNMAYSTFTILQIYQRGDAYLAQFDNPSVILIREGKNVVYDSMCKVIYEKEIYESNIKLYIGDMIILLTDGVTSAGLGRTTKNGWRRESVIEYVQRWYTPEMSPQRMAATIANASMDLYLNSPDDDITVAVFKICERKVVNLMIGPPEHKEDDNKVLKLFFSRKGKKIICGGTTSKIASRYLNKPIVINNNTCNEEIPSTACIEGVDLVTEGVITLEKVLNIAKQYSVTSNISLDLRNKIDGASMIAKILFEESTDINFFIGNAINPVHNDSNSHISYTIKLGIIRELEKILSNMGKNVKVSMC
ncbi:SpoIIE family protein phosphatase [Clostridium sp. UBA4395]|uniref:SpoIIE family protein phosphatase n=1 Tax=Clostridium sp. UBA4395 TaxID=1946360 RepID=UPI003217A14F